MLKKSDIILCSIVTILSFVLIFSFFIFQKPGSLVVVKVNGIITQQLPLSTNGTYEIKEDVLYNKFEISNGHVEMLESNCPDKLCLHQVSIQHSNQSIVCLPNKVILEIQNGSADEIDAIAN